MKRLLFALLALAVVGHAAEPERAPWTTSRIQGSPEPAKRCLAEQVYPELPVRQGLELVARDGRFHVMERGGRILSFRENPDTGADADLFVDLKALHPDLSNAYGIAFHPKWRENRQVFVTYTIGNNVEDGTKLSRFTFTATAPPKIEPASEEVILTWYCGGHNGANLQFGPDGMLYISTGDGTSPSPPDSFETGQDNSDLLSAVLRIDVDATDPGLAYRVPPDNPFVGIADVRPEIWSFGFRNPWKMSFDETGRLWVGDVGWELWEMIHLVGRGTNHGWSAMEASQPIKPETVSPLAPIVAPAAAHPHTEAASITGGFVYNGTRLPELRGAYVYGDYETGKIWALRHDGTRTTSLEEIADTPHRISTFGVGSDGELYYLHYGEPATMFRLAPNPKAGEAGDFPRLLSETGLFLDTAAQTPQQGVYEYTVVEPMWEDGATATRHIALPGDSHIRTEAVDKRLVATWPVDSVLAKTIRLGEKPVETQVLHFDGETWNAYAYRWNEARTDATLVAAVGEEFDVPAGGWRGGPRYRIPSRAECLRCHNVWNEHVAGFQPAQLAAFPAFPGHPAREATVALDLADGHYFERDTGGRLVSSNGPGSVETRARSWLHANCSHCHRRHGGGSAPLEVNFDRALSETALLWQAPTRGDFGLTKPHAVTPGEPWRSVLNYRVASVGSGHMPPIGAREVDERGAALLWEWVAGIPVAAMPRENPVETEPVERFDPVLLTNTSSAMRLAHTLASGKWEADERAKAVAAGLASEKPEIRTLFERFRPPGERPRLHRHDPAAILTLSGDPDKGAKLLAPTGKLAACFACHRLGDAGLAFGPDLDGVGARLDAAALLESLLAPSRVIASDYLLTSIETRSGQRHSGFVVSSDPEKLVLRTAPGLEITLPAAEVRRTLPQALSAMPEGLVDALEPQELADLIAWLASRKQAD